MKWFNNLVDVIITFLLACAEAHVDFDSNSIVVGMSISKTAIGYNKDVLMCNEITIVRS